MPPAQITYSDTTPAVTYDYDDAASNGIGRVRQVSNADATSTYSYDRMARVTQEQKTIAGLGFSTSYTYNLAGQQTSQTLPNGTVISKNYDSVGKLSSVTSDWVDANHPATLASSFSYHATGAISHFDYGNGTRTDRTYTTGGLLKNLQHGPSGSPGSFLNEVLNYNEGTQNTGRIDSIDDLNDASKSLSFTYDQLDRLATAETAGTHWGLSWTYDRYGNRTSQQLTKGSGPVQNSVGYDQTTNRLTGFSYDAAGNVTNDTTNSYAYNAENQITSSNGVTYKYDGQGSRVQKITATETISYVFGVGEYSSVSGWKKLYISVGGEKLAEYSGGTTYFFHADYKGSIRAMTDVAGNVAETWDSYPYGETWQQSGGIGNNFKYTGHERDSETGLDYAGARYLKQSYGRWMSVDPVLGEIWNPQRLNRYGYALNNPMNFVDRDGKNPVTVQQAFGQVCIFGAEGVRCFTVVLNTATAGGYVPQYIHPNAQGRPTPWFMRETHPVSEECADLARAALEYGQQNGASEDTLKALERALGTLNNIGVVNTSVLERIFDSSGILKQTATIPDFSVFPPSIGILINNKQIDEWWGDPSGLDEGGQEVRNRALTLQSFSAAIFIHELAHAGLFLNGRWRHLTGTEREAIADEAALLSILADVTGVGAGCDP